MLFIIHLFNLSNFKLFYFLTLFLFESDVGFFQMFVIKITENNHCNKNLMY